MLQNISISNKCRFELSIHQSPEKKNQGFHKNSFQHVSCFFKAANHHIRLISEGSCDTEDWSNDAENSALHNTNKLHLKYIK